MTPTSPAISGGRLAAIITGGALLTLATLVLTAAAAFSWIEGKKDRDGYYTTDSERFSTNTYALATDNLDVDDGLPGSDGAYGNVRLKVRSDDGSPVFVGIARTSDVDTYLGATAHATVKDIEFDDFKADYDTTGGTAIPAAPATQTIWAASSVGDGTRTLTWDVKDGDWSVVVMNADGSPGVATDISVGADAPIIGDLETASLIVGLILLVGGGGVMAGGLIRPRRRPSWPAESASAA
jgi:hypothetical protein